MTEIKLTDILLEHAKAHVHHALTVETWGKNGTVFNYAIVCTECEDVLESWDVDADGNPIEEEGNENDR